MIAVLSDLHLSDAFEARLFEDERHGAALERVCEAVAATAAQSGNGEAIFLGDVFDLTAMQPPGRGLERFFASLDLEPPQVRARPPLERLEAAAERNPRAIAALAQLSRRIPVTFVPGNHDWELDAPLLAALGITARVERSVVRQLDGVTVVLQHGHEQDASNRRPGGPGESMTRVLHQAVIPFLLRHGAKRNIRMDASRVVALRPEEAVISVLQRWLDEPTFERFFHALLRLLAENRYLPPGMSWLTKLVSPNRVRTMVQAQDRIWERTGLGASDALKGKRKLPHGAPRPDLLVMGHTHVPDWAPLDDGRLYVNLGTWTDRAFDAHSPKDMSLPYLLISEREAVLRDADGEIELQRWSR